MQLGALLILLMRDSTGLIEIRTDTVGRNHSRTNVHLTPEATEWFAQAHDRWAPSARAMLRGKG